MSVFDSSARKLISLLRPRSGRTTDDLKGQVEAIDRVMGVIEFTLDGTILTANRNFLDALGYTLDEVKGKHHSIFVDEAYRESAEYAAFWAKLGKGEFDAGQYLRLGKNGKAVWIQASYNPILNRSGRPVKVVKYATDITQQKERDAERAGQLAAIDRVMGVIEFSLDGTILKANDNFLGVIGYTLDEIRGKPHSMLVEPAYRDSPDYRAFWQRLGSGEFDAGKYKRIGKEGREVWIEASYNPILDAQGRPTKVVKYATDITEQQKKAADYASQMASISRVMGIVEFGMDGTILTANPNFLNAMGYQLDEIQGKHHSMFVSPDYRESAAYREFWHKLGQGQFHAEQFRRIAKGGRQVCIQASYNPVFDDKGRPYKIVKFATDITEQINNISSSMRVLITKAQGIANSVDTAAREISSENGDLSGRTEAQAASVEETASSMEELAGAVKQNSESATRASQLATSAKATAEKGNQVISDVVALMADIRTSTSKIADIIGVIDGIAFQTNILALNAAVEAARAGTEGRGFAVVATEVRSLAQRCSASAKEIRTLIGAAEERVRTGDGQVRQAGETMTELLKAVAVVNDSLSDIAAASREQSAGIEQVNRTIMTIDDSTQQNAALVEEVAASSRSLEEQSASLLEVVAELADDLRKKTLEDGQDGPARPTSVVAQKPRHPVPLRQAS